MTYGGGTFGFGTIFKISTAGTFTVIRHLNSTADGASHFVGKFFPSYFHDSSTEGFKEIEQRLREKITKDWERKIVLPEIKEAFRERYIRALEIIGEYPDKFIF